MLEYLSTFRLSHHKKCKKMTIVLVQFTKITEICKLKRRIKFFLMLCIL